MTISNILRLTRIITGSVIAASAAVMVPAPAQAAGDLLVAPTRIVLDGQRGTEIILNNIGAETATYRVSLELRRMSKEGRLTVVSPEEANQMDI